ncbi:MAG: bifunctional fucokinase/L-fucose-1-P-guanylyltransferase [Alloprevotella sp.]|nr:bifunctional fucokinase/L-fucose-1-P-guanylyltransferase [Alloprevotella sp.]
MRKLLSLPPNVVDKFHEVTRLRRDEFFCTCDPVGHKLGSGGGTAWILAAEEAARRKEHAGKEAEPREKRIVIHGGGQSRRLPAYAPSGKLLTPVPVYRWERGQRIDQTLLDLQLPLYESIMERTPAGLNTLVASGDVLLRATEPLQEIPDADVVCYGLWATPEQISHHGVFMMRRDKPSELDFMLQKPTAEEQAALMQTHYALIDVGVWILSDRAVAVLMKKAAPKGGTDADSFTFYDLYSDFGCALGNHPSKPDPEITCAAQEASPREALCSPSKEGAQGALSVCILPLPGGEFYHFGTGSEMLRSSMELQNLVKDQRLIIQRGVKKQSSVFTQNSLIPNRFTEEQEFIWVENSCLGDSWHLTRRNIVTGVPQNDWRVTLPEGICLDIVPVGERAFALRPYGYDDTFRGTLGDSRTTFLGRTLKGWDLERLGGEGCDIQNARLFPVSESLDELGSLLRWLLTGEGDGATYYNCTRMSAEELSEHANLARLFAQRRSLQAQNLPALAANWQKSVFYQLNLRDVAEKYAENALPLPAPLADEAPLMTRIHDAMFREVAGEADRGWDKRAFGLLKEGLTAEALAHTVMPRRTTLDDQIVWGRSAVRIDLAGGWTDTPPYCLLNGGDVVNVAINLNGQQPLQVYVKPCKEPVVICRSIDLGAMERIETYEELARYDKVGSPFSIPKAALTLCGFLPGFGGERYGSLRQQLEDFGCGIEITLLAAIPAGSGLGTSSVLAATVLGTLSDFCGLGWDKNEVGHRTLLLEQLLTTGGGWQDQYGGILPGAKLLQSEAGFGQNVTARYLPDTLFSAPELRDCHLLYYTGITRTAKHILAEIVRGMFLNQTEHLRTLRDMREHAHTVAEAVQLCNFPLYGELIRRTWTQNQRLDSGTNPPAVAALCQRVDDLCLGYKLPGAGGGGFLYMVAKDPEAALRIRRMLTENPANAKARFVELGISRTGLEISRS